MCKFPLETQQSNIVVNNILSQTTIPELAQYFHAALFTLAETSLFKEIKMGWLMTWPGLTEGLIKKHL